MARSPHWLRRLTAIFGSERAMGCFDLTVSISSDTSQKAVPCPRFRCQPCWRFRMGGFGSAILNGELLLLSLERSLTILIAKAFPSAAFGALLRTAMERSGPGSWVDSAGLPERNGRRSAWIGITPA